MNLIAAAAIVVGLLLVGAVGQLIETTFTRLGRARARSLDERGRHTTPLAPVLDDREVVIGPASLARLAAHVGIGVVIAVVVGDRWGGWMAVIVAVVVVLVAQIVSSSIPRRLALESNDRMALSTAPAIRRLAGALPVRLVMAPLGRLTAALTPTPARPAAAEVGEDELIALAEEAAEAEVIETTEAGLIESIIALGDTIVREVMVPRPDMITVPADMSVDAGLERIVDSGYTRLPVHGSGGVDDVVGVVLSKDLLKAHLAECGERMVVALARDAWFVPETKKAAELMREMQSRKVHLAITVDEYGATSGLVTLEDIIEELVGEIVDEYDQEKPLIEQAADGSLTVSGRLPIDQFSALVEGDLPDGNWDTVGGLLFDLLGHVPVEGEAVEWDGHELRATRVHGRRIELVSVTVLDRPPA